MVADIIRASSVLVAMAVVGVLTWKALSIGVDGAVFMSAMVVIGGLGGYEVKALVEKKKSKSPPAG
ncbi:hypothetical protein ES705_30158 [subsurface metagenome]